MKTDWDSVPEALIAFCKSLDILTITMSLPPLAKAGTIWYGKLYKTSSCVFKKVINSDVKCWDVWEMGREWKILRNFSF